MGCGGSKENQSGGSSAPLPGEESRGAAASAAAAAAAGSTAGGSQIEGPLKAYSGEKAHVSATPGEWEEGGLSGEGEAGGPGASMNHGSSNLSSMKGDLIRLRIIHINDVYELENLPRFATCVQEYKSRDAEDQCQTIVMLPGDFLAPSLLSSLDHGFGMVDCLNKCGVDYACFGNHETDVPHAELVKRIQESKFKWINT
jgi:2',3'-cyclic-nucleotide 2'-phosphodiesterase (5'-nucleotidase family)